MKQLNILLILCLLVGLSSCNDDDIFKKEMYEHFFALVSADDYNIVEEVHRLTGTESIGYVSASVGGTTATDKDIDITLVEDDEQLSFYNRAIYDADESRYAKLMPKDKYVIDDYKIKIPAGETIGKMMIRTSPEGLSPDSAYFIALKVSDYSAYKLHEKRSTILYRVLIENDYATQAFATSYKSDGFMKIDPLLDEKHIGSEKIMHPLTWNRVRTTVGNELFQENDVEAINRVSIILEVTEDNKVRILPYKDDKITVKRIDDEKYPNTFHTEVSYGKTFNVFLLCYEYSIGGGTTILMKEELRRQMN